MPVQSSLAHFFNEGDSSRFLFAYLSLQDLRNYGLTCKLIYSDVHAYLHHWNDINRLLTMFIDQSSTAYFREAQRATGALIGGSFALQFFGRVVYNTSDLDIYVHTLFAEVLMDMLDTIGCQRSLPPTTMPAAGYSSNKHRFVDFISPTDRIIQVVITQSRPVQAILGYHSTAVMNFLSGWYAYSLYGQETLNDGLSLYLGPDRGERYGAKAKYEKRGWTTVLDRNEANGLSAFNPVPRLIGDARTWIIKLDDSTKQGTHGYRDPFIRDAGWLLMALDSGESYIEAL